MRKFWFILGLALFSLMMTACEKSEFDSENPDAYFEQFIHRNLPRLLPEHWFFEDDRADGQFSYRGNPCEIYFLDEQGNNLIDLDDRSTWPVPCYKEEYVANPDSYYDTYRFVAANGYTSNPAYNLFAPIDGQHTMTYPLRFRGRDYEIALEYLYTDEGFVGGRGMYTNIFRCKFEGRFIFSDFEDPKKESIIVTLDKNGDIVSLQRKERDRYVN